MSALICLRGTDGVVLVSDGICYAEDGMIMGTRVSKVMPFNEWNCVVGAVGAGPVLHAFRDRLQHRPEGFDDVKRVAVDYLQDVHRDLERQNYYHPVHFTVLLTGISEETGEFESLAVSSREKPAAGDNGLVVVRPAWELTPLPWLWSSAATLSEPCKQFGIDFESREAFGGCANAIDLGVRLVCALRSTSGPIDPELSDDPGHFAVGGFIQTTLFTRDRIEQRIVHRWPDEWGKYLDPAAGDAKPFLSWDPETLAPRATTTTTPDNTGAKDDHD